MSQYYKSNKFKSQDLRRNDSGEVEWCGGGTADAESVCCEKRAKPEGEALHLPTVYVPTVACAQLRHQSQHR